MIDKFEEFNRHATGGCGGHSHQPGHKCCGQHGHGSHKHEGGCCGQHKKDASLTVLQEELVNMIKTAGCIPVVQFVMKSSKSSHFEAVALSPVFLTSVSEKMESVKSTGSALLQLSEMGLISLDYDIPVSNYDYSEYYNSDIFAEFSNVMKESADKEDFVFDIADMEKGSAVMCEE